MYERDPEFSRAVDEIAQAISDNLWRQLKESHIEDFYRQQTDK